MLDVQIHQEVLTPQDVAKLLRRTTYTIRRWINQKRLKASKVNGQWRIHRTDIFDFLAQQRGDAGATS